MNLRDSVFTPLSLSAMTRDDIVALLCSLRPPRGVTQRRDAGTSAGRRDTMTPAKRPSTRARQTPIQVARRPDRVGRGGLGPMTKPLDRHPGNLVFLAVRAWFLDAVRTWCPEVLEDLRRTVYVPLEARVGREDAAVLLGISPCPAIVTLKRGFSGWAPTIEAGHRLDTRRSLASGCGSGRHTRATLGEKTTGCDRRL